MQSTLFLSLLGFAPIGLGALAPLRGISILPTGVRLEVCQCGG